MSNESMTKDEVHAEIMKFIWIFLIIPAWLIMLLVWII